jgi:hypothetical protein
VAERPFEIYFRYMQDEDLFSLPQHTQLDASRADKSPHPDQQSDIAGHTAFYLRPVRERLFNLTLKKSFKAAAATLADSYSSNSNFELVELKPAEPDEEENSRPREALVRPVWVQHVKCNESFQIGDYDYGAACPCKACASSCHVYPEFDVVSRRRAQQRGFRIMGDRVDGPSLIMFILFLVFMGAFLGTLEWAHERRRRRQLRSATEANKTSGDANNESAPSSAQANSSSVVIDLERGCSSSRSSSRKPGASLLARALRRKETRVETMPAIEDQDLDADLDEAGEMRDASGVLGRFVRFLSPLSKAKRGGPTKRPSLRSAHGKHDAQLNKQQHRMLLLAASNNSSPSPSPDHQEEEHMDNGSIGSEDGKLTGQNKSKRPRKVNFLCFLFLFSRHC